MSTEQRETLDAILRQSAFPVGSGVDELRRLFREAVSAQPPPADVTVTAATLGGVPAAEITVDGVESRHGRLLGSVRKLTGAVVLRRSLMAGAGAALVALAMSAGASAAPAGKSGQREQGRAQVLIRGAAIHGANGLAIDPHGRLLVASVFGAQLVALDRRSGRVVTRLGHDSGVDAPDDVATGPDGSIYWTDTILGQVGRLAPNGTVTKQYVAAGVNPIAFSSDGRLFVGQAFSGDGLYEVDPNLSQAPRVVIPDSHTAPFAQQLNGFDFGPDAKRYAPQPFLGTIMRIDPESGKTEVVSDALVGRFPSSVEFDSRGRLYASLNDGTVVRVDRDTGAAATVVKIPDARSTTWSSARTAPCTSPTSRAGRSTPSARADACARSAAGG